MRFGKVWLAALLAGSTWGRPAAAQSSPPARLLAQLPAPARQAVAQAAFETYAARLYAQSRLGSQGLALSVFREALVGYYNLRARTGVASSLLTIIDFARSSQTKRLWVLDLAQGKLLYHTLVAHGKSTGADLARSFSNEPGSEQSSLGFYRTRATYMGKHGLSLKIQGLDPAYNSNAESRAVVVHGVDYVCEDFVRRHGRLGRSQGCPALPLAEAPAIVRTIQGGSILYLHGPAEAGYQSPWLNVGAAAQAFARQQEEAQ